MSGFRTHSGHVLGATTIGGGVATPIATGHRTVAAYVIVVSVACAALVAFSKLVMRVAIRLHR